MTYQRPTYKKPTPKKDSFTEMLDASPEEYITIPVFFYELNGNTMMVTGAFGSRMNIYFGKTGVIEPIEDEDGTWTLTYNPNRTYMKTNEQGYTNLFINK